jgi:iron(III) transport system substrate-binding protein
VDAAAQSRQTEKTRQERSETKMRMSSIAAILPALVLTALAAPAPSRAADVPKAMQAILGKLNLDPSVLSGLDQELAVPDEWIEGAKKEGKLAVITTERPERFEALIAPFRERYPYIKLAYNLAVANEQRIVEPLTAFKQGRYLTDVLVGLSGNTFLFKQADALTDLRDLPTYGTAFDNIHDPDGMSVSFRTRRWCLGYNTSKVAASELPKSWDDLVGDPRWMNRKIGLGDRPNLWLPNLWNANGEAWGRQFTDKLFAQTPQLRKEGLDAMLSLVIAGEFDLSLPTADNRVLPWIDKHAPISYFCPTPAPLSTSEMGILRGSPDLYAAKIYVNWTLSKEGQIAQFYATKSPPVHRDLQDARFIPFADQVAGKKVALAGSADLAKEVLTYWQQKWTSQGSGAAP